MNLTDILPFITMAAGAYNPRIAQGMAAGGALAHQIRTDRDESAFKTRIRDLMANGGGDYNSMVSALAEVNPSAAANAALSRFTRTEDREFRSGESEKDRKFRSGESEKDRKFRSGEAEKGRAFRHDERLGSELARSTSQLLSQLARETENEKNRQAADERLRTQIGASDNRVDKTIAAADRRQRASQEFRNTPRLSSLLWDRTKYMYEAARESGDDEAAAKYLEQLKQMMSGQQQSQGRAGSLADQYKNDWQLRQDSSGIPFAPAHAGTPTFGQAFGTDALNNQVRLIAQQQGMDPDDPATANAILRLMRMGWLGSR